MGRPGKCACAGRQPRACELYPVRRSARIRGNRRGAGWAALALALLTAAASVAGAQAEPAPPERDRATAVDAAREHFERGMEHYRARRYRAAIHEFRLSVAGVPNADLWFNMARAYEQLGEAAQAVDHYRLDLRDRVDAPDADEVEQRIADLYARTPEGSEADRPGRGQPSGSLAVTAAEPGMLLLVDGRSVGRSPVERVLELSPGTHRVEATKDGRIPYRAQIDVHPNAVSAAYVDLRPRTHHARAHGPRPWTWIAAAASAGALIAGGTLSLEALDRREAGDRALADDLQFASAVAFGGGLVLAATAAVLFFMEDRRDDTDAPIRATQRPR